MKKVATVICFIELILLVLVPISAWVAYVLGADVVNLLSKEGIRWLFSHAAENLMSPHTTLLIMVLSAAGALRSSGLVSDIVQLCHTPIIRRAIQHPRAFYISSIVFFAGLLLIFSPVLFKYQALLSITGTLFPYSPWLTGFPFALCTLLIITSLVYHISSDLQGWGRVPSIITYGLEKYSLWIVITMMGGMLYHVIKYCIF